MQKTAKLVLAGCLSMFTLVAISAPKIGGTLKQITLDGDTGGLVTGKPWKSSSLTGKVHALFYVDPDERDANEELKKALHKAAFSHKDYQSTVIINMDATMIPNFILSGLIEDSQKENPQAVYVKDLDKKLVKEWSLKDDAFHVLILNKSGKVVFEQSGSLTKPQVQSVISLIKSEIQKN